MLFITCNVIKSYTITSNKPGPITLIIATTHGNEPAGFYGIHRFIDTNPAITHGSIILIPSLNSCGLALNMRNNPFGNYDINRNYMKDYFLNNQIQKLVQKADFVIDCHEGFGFRKLNTGSIGSGIYAGNTKEAQSIALTLIEKINPSISEEYKKFSTANISTVHGSLRDLCQKLNKHYILIETSGINNIQPLDLRIQQHQFFIENAIKEIYFYTLSHK
jgi:predicted deacylase